MILPNYLNGYMKSIYKIIVFTTFLINSSFLLSQSKNLDAENKWFLGGDFGIQMSGIKNEDFVEYNYSQMIRLFGGKWINPKIGMQIGYQGRYFNTIEDNDKHFYNFYFLEGVLNFKNLVSNQKEYERFYDLMFHAGLGLFQNRYYGNSSIHYVLGVANNFSLSKKTKIKLDIGAIVGWDIYQGDDDILPNLSIGLNYFF